MEDHTTEHSNGRYYPRLREYVIAEYSRLSDEINGRVHVQNMLIQRALYILGIVGTILVTFISYIFQNHASDLDGRMITSSGHMLMLIGLFVIFFVGGILSIAIIFNWIFQIQMIFRTNIYVSWMAKHIIEHYDQVPAQTPFRGTREIDPHPWHQPLGPDVVRYFQVAAPYIIVAIMTGGQVITVVLGAARNGVGSVIAWLAMGAAAILVAGVWFSYIAYKRIHQHNGRLKSQIERNEL